MRAKKHTGSREQRTDSKPNYLSSLAKLRGSSHRTALSSSLDVSVSAMQAIVSNGPGVLRLATDVPVPNIESSPRKVLVKIKAVALNHSDWKMADFSPKPGAVSGYDMAGTVVAVGKSVISRLEEGDMVLGVTSINGGAFAEYAECEGDLLIKMSPSMDVVEASTLGVGLATAGLALFAPEFLGLNMPSSVSVHPTAVQTTSRVGPRGWGVDNDNSDEDDADADSYNIPVLVYGASTATGTIVLQLLRLSGYAPMAVCSPKNFTLAKSRGAVECFDYHSSSCVTQIKQRTQRRLAYALDCITNASSMKLCYEAMGTAGGKYVSLDPFSTRIEKTRKDIVANFCYALTLFGLPVELAGSFARDARPEDYTFALKWMKTAEDLLSKDKIQAHPAILKPGGLAGVIDGIDLLRKGKISGQKLVYRI